MNKLFYISFFFLISCTKTVSENTSTISLNSLFSEKMVLQQNSNVPIWGFATPSKIIEVSASWGETVLTKVISVSCKFYLDFMMAFCTSWPSAGTLFSLEFPLQSHFPLPPLG